MHICLYICIYVSVYVHTSLPLSITSTADIKADQQKRDQQRHISPASATPALVGNYFKPNHSYGRSMCRTEVGRITRCRWDASGTSLGGLGFAWQSLGCLGELGCLGGLEASLEAPGGASGGLRGALEISSDLLGELRECIWAFLQALGIMKLSQQDPHCNFA